MSAVFTNEPSFVEVGRGQQNTRFVVSFPKSAERKLLQSEVDASTNKSAPENRNADQVEAVVYRGDTLCLSTQVGCAVACPFCASGANGLGRQLTHEELVFQVNGARERFPIKRLTLSGVGEPLHNHAVTFPFLGWAKNEGLYLSLTTSGGPLSRLETWLMAPHNGLTISVHAGTEKVRKIMVPKGPPLSGLFDTLGAALPTTSRRRRKKTALAYLLVEGQNDHDNELDAFVERVLSLGAVASDLSVHLYDLNPVPNSPYRGVARKRYEAVFAYLSKALPGRVSMSSTARLEANGGCGTLVALARKKV